MWLKRYNVFKKMVWDIKKWEPNLIGDCDKLRGPDCFLFGLKKTVSGEVERPKDGPHQII